MKDDIDGRSETFSDDDITKIGSFESSCAAMPESSDGMFGRDLLPDEHIIMTSQKKNAKGPLFEKVFSIFSDRFN